MLRKDYPTELNHAVSHLATQDPVLAKVIATTGLPTFMPHNDYYLELVNTIISQQLSVKAARTIRQRVFDIFGGVPNPQAILQKNVDELRAAGLSRAKANYIIDLARHIEGGSLQIGRLPDLSNDEIVRELTAIKGIGEWTAHMFLIFALGRLDVLPTGDLGFKGGLQKLYNLPALPTPAEITALAQQHKWHPYESIVAWYAWQVLDNTPAEQPASATMAG